MLTNIETMMTARRPRANRFLRSHQAILSFVRRIVRIAVSPMTDARRTPSVIGETAVLTILLTKLKVAWWLRRKRFALGRLAVVVVSMFFSMITVLLLVLT